MFEAILQNNALRQKLLQAVSALGMLTVVFDKTGPHVIAVAFGVAMAAAITVLFAAWFERSRRGMD